MSIKCAILEYDWENPAPTYTNIDVNFGKNGKVLYGGGKRKSKTTPYLDKADSLLSSFVCFSKLLFPQLGNSHNYFELYFFGNHAHETMLYLKYPKQVVTHFIIDEDLIDNLHHLKWSFEHLERFVRELESTGKSLNFYIEKEIGDAKLYKSFPAYKKANDKLINDAISASRRMTDMAGLILKSGW
ncbi:hypothetical protein M2128_000090 [Polynucleobacter sphagniphilus]|uniref:hypothetical protein n=1 Tax=Polynucleobacter sphagniphilus TaxID=1743169 RepID=UPI0024755BCE|nr:hypothetical protein [Polynucleobacter sphagniphilus]MDH6301188.1 hypothetical protein [Polynucleobacter sphagniphilus]